MDRDDETDRTRSVAVGRPGSRAIGHQSVLPRSRSERGHCMPFGVMTVSAFLIIGMG
jgi:hypothetical protein